MAVSTFTWLDHREDDAQRVREALAAFDEKGMVDPLGFGPVRDALSEMLFPGISTVQTRARYFLLVPWIYTSLDADGIRPEDGPRVAREREVALIEALLRGSDDYDGIIGQVARHGTKQLPSFIYWGGLGRWGIRWFAGTRVEYLATLDARHRSRRPAHLMGAEAVDGAASPWHPGLPDAPDGLLDATTLDLTGDEALFLQGRILDSVPDTYLALLASDGRSTDVADVPWEHPLAATTPSNIRRQLRHSSLFSLASWGAGLVYNDELSRLLERDGGEPLGGDYEEQLEAWCDEMDRHSSQFSTWDRQDFWHLISTENPYVSTTLRLFVDWWLDTAVNHLDSAATSRDVRDELRRREAAIKGPRAKLANRRARERSPSPQGDAQMTFRWRQVERILGDIHRGLEGDAQPA